MPPRPATHAVLPVVAVALPTGASAWSPTCCLVPTNLSPRLRAPCVPPRPRQVTITTDTSAVCTNEVLPITYPKFPAMCEVIPRGQPASAPLPGSGPQDQPVALGPGGVLPIVYGAASTTGEHGGAARRCRARPAAPPPAVLPTLQPLFTPVPLPPHPTHPPQKKLKLLQVGDSIFLGRYLATGADESSVYLTVSRRPGRAAGHG